MKGTTRESGSPSLAENSLLSLRCVGVVMFSPAIYVNGHQAMPKLQYVHGCRHLLNDVIMRAIGFVICGRAVGGTDTTTWARMALSL